MPAVPESVLPQASAPPLRTSRGPVTRTAAWITRAANTQLGRRRSRADFMQRFYLSRLHVHLILLALVAFVPTAGLLLGTTLEHNRYAVAAARQDALRWARVIAGEHERAIETARQLLTMLAQLPDIRQQRPDRCNALVTDLLRRYSRYANLGAVTLNGSVFCSAAPPSEPIDLGGGAHFWRAVENGGFGVGDYRVDRVTGRTTVNVSYPLIDDTGAVQGAVFAALDLTWLTQLPALARLPEGSTLTISDRQGRVRFRFPDPARWVGQTAWDKTIVDRMATLGEGAIEAAGADGGNRFLGFTLLPAADGGESAYLAVAIPHEAAVTGPGRALARSLPVLAALATLALVAARVVGNRVGSGRRGAAAPAPLDLGGREEPRVGTPERLGKPAPPAKEARAAVEAQPLPVGPARPKPDPQPERRRAGERRSHPRAPVAWPVRVWLQSGAAAVGRVVDASTTGMRIVIAGDGRVDLLELERHYRVEVSHPGMRSGFIRVGEVRHLGDHTIGLAIEEELPHAVIPQQGTAPSRSFPRLARDQRKGAA
jgi:cache domain-containing protein